MTGNEWTDAIIGAAIAVHPIDKALALSHLRLMNLNAGLFLNLHEAKLVDRLHRVDNNDRGPRVSE